MDGDRGAVKSPIMAALFLEGRHKARVLAQPRDPAAGEAQQHPAAEPAVGAQQHRSSRNQLPQTGAEDGDRGTVSVSMCVACFLSFLST